MRPSKSAKKKGKLMKKRIHKHRTQSPTTMDMREGRQDWIKKRDKKK